MILTVTLNPAVDQTIFVDRLELGDVNRFADSQLDPAGKGINVSRMVDRLGWPTVAFGFLGGEVGRIVVQALDAEGVPHHFAPIPGQTRLNVTIVDAASGESTSFYGPGPAIDGGAHARLDGLIELWLQASRVLVLAGSQPPGCPEDVYATYIGMAKARGAMAILDADGDAFRQGLAAGPALVKPNREEAERLLGRALPDIASVVAGARDMLEWGAGTVVVSLGAEGAVLVDGRGAWRAISPPVVRRSTVGSGDSMVAGLAVALARGDDLVEGLRLGAAAGAATAATPGTSLATAAEVAALVPGVRIEPV